MHLGATEEAGVEGVADRPRAEPVLPPMSLRGTRVAGSVRGVTRGTRVLSLMVCPERHEDEPLRSKHVGLPHAVSIAWPVIADREHAGTVRAFFDAMNAQDADAAAALVSEDVAVQLGPHRFAGRSAVRELAVQTDDQLAFETVVLALDAGSDADIRARALRTQRWRSTGEVADESELHARFTFDGSGSITRIVLT